jgi:putative DNA primase/helicase
VRLSASNDDGFVVHSFAGDDPLRCRDYVRERLGFGPFKPNGGAKPDSANAEKQRVRTFTYEYRDPATGEPLYRKIRHEYGDGSKSFFFEPKGRGGSAPLLYRGERLADLGEGESVWIVEGEAKVDRLQQLGATAVSLDAGAKSKWLPTHAELLRGLPVILWPDSDVPGEAYITSAEKVLHGLAASIRVVRPFGPPNGSKGLDACDWTGDADALTKLARSAESYEPWTEAPRGAKPNGAGVQGDQVIVELECAANIKPEPILWLWENWLALGKLHILAGQPGKGKSTIAIKIAAAGSSGGKLPDGKNAKRGNVIIWSGEDDASDTLTPRLEAAGADMSRVHIVRGAKDGKGKRPFDPSKDVLALCESIKGVGAVLIIIDPIVMAVARDSHKNAETRRELQPLVDLAAELKAALLGVTHFTKGTEGRAPIDRVTGSLAFGALARVVWVAAQKQDDEEGGPGARVLMLAKSNIGPDKGGFEYELRQSALYSNPDIIASVVSWGDAIDGNARDVLAEAEAVKDRDDDKATALRETKEFLLDLLANGPLPAKEIAAAAREAKQGWRTVERAKSELKISTGKRGDGYPWSLPQDQEIDSTKKPWRSWRTSTKANKNKEFNSANNSANSANLADMVGGHENEQNQKVNPTPPTPPSPPRCREGIVNQLPDDTVEVEL